jgi:hypothetical protein
VPDSAIWEIRVEMVDLHEILTPTSEIKEIHDRTREKLRGT